MWLSINLLVSMNLIIPSSLIFRNISVFCTWIPETYSKLCKISKIGLFYESSERLRALDCFHKNLRFRCLTKLQCAKKYIDYHCVKSVCVRSDSGPQFSVFGLNTERYVLRIQYECGKIRTRITPNTDTFYEVYFHSRC